MRYTREKLPSTFFFPVFLFFIFYCCLVTVVPIFLPLLTPTLHPPPTFNPSPPSIALSMGPLYMFLDDPSPSFPVIPSPTHSGYCQFVLYFHVSGSILLACVFWWLVSTYRSDNIVSVFHIWLISFNMMLSTSIHAVMKGRSSFFLSAE